MASRAVLELKKASRVARHQDVQFGLPYPLHLAIEDLHRKLGLGQVIDTRAAAALIRSFHLDQFDSRNGLEQGTWGPSDALGVEEVARIIVSDPLFHLMS